MVEVWCGRLQQRWTKDIFFTGNMVENELFLNRRQSQIQNVTNKSGIKKMVPGLMA